MVENKCVTVERTRTKPKPIQGQIFTDASHYAWGAAFNRHSAQGYWNQQIKHKSSNYRELLAIILTPELFRPEIRGQHINIISYNVTSLDYLNHLGGHCKDLNNLSEGIWELALDLDVTLSRKHLSGKLNTTADKLSRLSPKYEWKLNPDLFRAIEYMWNPHDIDQFATMQNTQLENYNSIFQDPHSAGVDALAQQDWGQKNNYVNPPFRLLPQMIDVIKAYVTVIVPLWEGQLWCQKLKHLSVENTN